jgi:DNA-binding PadR family transcriptional regulator
MESWRALLTNISKIRIIILLNILVLKPADFHILLALAGGPLHGYRIMKHVERDTAGEVTLEIGSLYRLLARLVTEGLIDHIDSPDERRRYYRITAAGRKALKSEAARLANVVTLVRARKLLPETDV